LQVCPMSCFYSVAFLFDFPPPLSSRETVGKGRWPFFAPDTYLYLSFMLQYVCQDELNLNLLMERVPGLLNCPIVHISVLQFQLYLVLLPVDGQTIPHLEKPYLSCQPTLSIQHLVEVIAFLMDRLLEF
jgi:hypothetical protein